MLDKLLTSKFLSFSLLSFQIEVGADLVGNDFNFLDPSSAQPRDSPLDDCNAMSGGKEPDPPINC